MQEHFCFTTLKKAGFFTPEMKNDYEAQAERVCKFFGFKTVYEYGKEEISCHITYSEGQRPLHINESGEIKPEPFVTVFKSIYE